MHDVLMLTISIPIDFSKPFPPISFLRLDSRCQHQYGHPFLLDIFILVLDVGIPVANIGIF